MKDDSIIGMFLFVVNTIGYIYGCLSGLVISVAGNYIWDLIKSLKKGAGYEFKTIPGGVYLSGNITKTNKDAVITTIDKNVPNVFQNTNS